MCSVAAEKQKTNANVNLNDDYFKIIRKSELKLFRNIWNRIFQMKWLAPKRCNAVI